MRNLIKKILQETDEWGWADEIVPTVGQRLEKATENNPRINVILDDGQIHSIDDENGYHYISNHTIVTKLPKGKEAWTNDVVLQVIIDEVGFAIERYEHNGDRGKDYHDYIYLRETLRKVFF